MIKSLKNKVISVLALVACVMFAFLIGINVNVAKADQSTVNTDVFTMYNTASIRGTEDGLSPGIRFIAKLGYDKFKTLKGDADGVEVVLVANKAGADESLAVSKTFNVTESTFANDSDKIIEIKYTLLFDNDWSEAKLAEAITMDLTVDCYAKVGEVKTPATVTGITQNARAVASFNDILDGDDRYAGVYYNQATVLDGVSTYVAGTVGVKIDLDGATAGSDVYINTTKVNAVIEDGVITLAKEDMAKLLTTVNTNFIQVIDADGNVIAKELTDQIPVYEKTVTFSAVDGDIDSAVLGGEQITAAEVISNDAVDGAFAALDISTGKILGLQTKRDGWTNAQIKVSSAYSTTIVNLVSATKIIDDASDMDMFEISTTNEYFVKDGSCYKMDGYFVLANDITLDTALVHDTIPNDGGDADNTYWNNSLYGFRGVFDGQGYSLTAPIEQKGLFGALSAGVVIKNTHFNLTVNSTTRSASGLFHQYSGSIGYVYSVSSFAFENLWIKVSGQSVNFSPICSRGNNCYYYTNVFIDLSDLECTTGYIWGASQTHSFDKYHVDKLSGIYIVSEQPFLLWSGVNVVPANMYDSFDGIEYIPGTTTIESGKTYKYEASGVNQYSDIKAMLNANATLPVVDNGDGVVMSATKIKADLSEEITISLKDGETDVPFTLSSSNANFTISGNKVVGAGNGAAVITATYQVDGKTHSKTIFMVSGYDVKDYNTADTPYVFSADDGELPSDMLASGEKVVSATATNQTLTVEDNKIKGFTLSTDSNGRDVVTSALIEVSTDQKNLYKLHVKAYTKTIDSEEDMLYFNLSEEKSLTGTYIMTANVNVSETTASKITHDAVTAIGDADYGLKGIFDGDGYTLSGYIPTKGYFGAMRYYGEIKNLGINATPYSTSGVSNAVFALAGGSGTRLPLVMSDVSVKVSGTVSTFVGLFGRAFGFINSNSLFVDLSELTANSGYVISSDISTGYIKQANIYAVSSLEIAKVTHWRGGKLLTSNQAIADDVEMKNDGGYYYNSNGTYWTFDGSQDNSATNAKGILYASYEELLKNQTAANSYTGYGSTGAQFSNTTYWTMTQMTEGDYTGYVPVWKTKA